MSSTKASCSLQIAPEEAGKMEAQMENMRARLAVSDFITRRATPEETTFIRENFNMAKMFTTDVKTFYTGNVCDDGCFEATRQTSLLTNDGNQIEFIHDICMEPPSPYDKLDTEQAEEKYTLNHTSSCGENYKMLFKILKSTCSI